MTRGLDKLGLVVEDEKIGMTGFGYLGYSELSYHRSVSDLCRNHLYHYVLLLNLCWSYLDLHLFGNQAEPMTGKKLFFVNT